MLQLKLNMFNTIYVISNMHINYNLGICPSGHSSLQKVSPLYKVKGVGSIPMLNFFFLSFFNIII
jgi:hypothetical protein